MNDEQREESVTTVREETEVTRTEETGTTSTADPHGTTPAGEAATELTKVRELVIQANPDVVPDLVRGNSVDELVASVEPAKAAYQRIADRVRGSQSTTLTAEPGATVNASGDTTVVVQPPQVPAGGAQAPAVNPNDIPPTEKIARAVAERNRR